MGSDNANSYVDGEVLKVDGAETVKIVINTNLRTISGTVYHTCATAGNELKDVWIEVVNTANGMHYGVSATSTTGAYTIAFTLAALAMLVAAVLSLFLKQPSFTGTRHTLS